MTVVAAGVVPHCHSTFDGILNPLLPSCMLLPARMAHVLPPSGFMNFSRNCWTEKPVNASSHPTQYEADKVKAYTFKLRVRFELTIPVAERWKTAHVFDKAAIAIGLFMRRIRI